MTDDTSLNSGPFHSISQLGVKQVYGVPGDFKYVSRVHPPDYSLQKTIILNLTTET